MSNNEVVWNVMIVLILIGILVYLGYKRFYEYNINLALNKRKAFRLPRISVVLLFYIGICTAFVICISNREVFTKELCIQDEYFPGIMYDSSDKPLNMQLSQWIMEQNNVHITKTDLGDRFEVFIGEAEDGNFAMFLTYRLHGLEPYDEVSASLKDLHDGSASLWSNDPESGNDTALQNGQKIYAYSFSSIKDTTCSEASFTFHIQVKNHPELSATKKIKIVFHENASVTEIKN